MKFLITSEFAELLDLGMELQRKSQEVLWYVPNSDYEKIGENILDPGKHWWRRMGQGYIWLFDGCSQGKFQDWLREKGELVVGGSDGGDKLENDRQLNQKWFAKAGFDQPFSKNFTDIDECIKFATEWFKAKKGKLILKQNGNAPKSINYRGKFEGGEDLIYHLENAKKGWSETQFGKFDCDLMQVVEGVEVAASAFFNGKNFLKNSQGKVVGFLNFEEKKEIDGGLGETVGEMGTTFIGVTEANPLFKEIMLKPDIVSLLQKIGFRGVFDINCIKTDKGLVALEPTMRFGIPATSYEFMEGLLSPLPDLLSMMAKGEDKAISIREGVGMVMVIVAKPYPIEHDVDEEATSIGEKLWILKNGIPVKEFSEDQKNHIRLQNFYKDDEGNYKVATKNGYLLTTTSSGKTVKETRERLLKYIPENIFVAGIKYRQDIGKRIEDFVKQYEK